MKRNYLITIIFTLLFSAAAMAQEFVEGPDTRPQPKRPNLLKELDLDQSQVQQIRRIYGERGPQMKQAQMRLREANRALDDAIYDQETSDNQIQSLMKDVQSAQMDVIRLRTQTETEVRRVLTREQLIKFRDLRRQFNKNKGARMSGDAPPLRPRMDQRPIQQQNQTQNGQPNPNGPAKRIFNRRQMRKNL